MILENQAARQAYIQLLIDTLKKKSEVLKRLLSLTEKQESIIAEQNFQDEDFLEVVSLKEEQINQLTILDDGFEQLYASVKEELFTGQEKYKAEITTLKELIAFITDTSVKLQALEKRNKAKMEVYFSNKRMEIKKSRLGNTTVTNYYKNIAKSQQELSHFYDKKN